MGANNAHPGGGYFLHLGGTVYGDEGTGCSDTNTYHNTILSNENVAQGAVSGSKYSIKTPYSGNCPNESFSRDTTIIQLNENKQNVFIRFYQKFTGEWNSSTVQHKFTKFHPIGDSSDTVSTGYFSFRPGSKNLYQAKVNNVEGQFNYSIYKLSSVCHIFATQEGAGSQYENGYRYWDNYNNSLNLDGIDREFEFETDRWYCIEIHVKINSSEKIADAVSEMWVDGKKVFSLTNFRWYGPQDEAISGIGTFELQHVYYNRSNTNQPTYMDNIVIADEYIGPIGSSSGGAEPDTVKNLKIISQ